MTEDQLLWRIEKVRRLLNGIEDEMAPYVWDELQPIFEFAKDLQRECTAFLAELPLEQER